MKANFAMPAGVSNVWRPFDQRLVTQLPANAASMVPVAMDADFGIATPDQELK